MSAVSQANILLNQNAVKSSTQVITGRDPADFLFKCADYITLMECVRHPYDKGVRTRIGIEY